MSFTLCTSEAIVAKAGANVNATAAVSGSLLEQFSEVAEGWLAAQTRVDWVANYAKVPTTLQPVLAEPVAAWAAKKLIAYNKLGYLTGEANDLENINHDEALKAAKELSDDKVKTMMGVR